MLLFRKISDDVGDWKGTNVTPCGTVTDRFGSPRMTPRPGVNTAITLTVYDTRTPV